MPRVARAICAALCVLLACTYAGQASAAEIPATLGLDLSATPKSAQVGGALPVTFEATREGEGLRGASIAFYLSKSKSARPDSSAPVVGRVSLSELVAEPAFSSTADLVVPPGLDAGDYRLFGCFTSVRPSTIAAPCFASSAPVAVTAIPGPSITERIRDFGTQWSGFLGILFMAALVYFFWRTLKAMPRTKPVQIRPDVKTEVEWADIAGVDEAKRELQEVVDFLREPEGVHPPRREGPAGRPAARSAGHRQDPARKGGRARVGRRVLLAVGVVVRRDVRRPGRGAHPAPVPRGAQATRRRSSSSTSSTPSAPSAAATTTPSASRRSTSCSSRWTASAAPRT